MFTRRRFSYPALLLTIPLWLTGHAGAEEFRLCTGNPGKTYHAVGTTLAELMPSLSRQGLRVTVVPTEGSVDNLQRLLDGQCEAAISQGDVVARLAEEAQPGKDFRLITALYKELSLLICRRDAGVDEVADLLSLSDPVVAAGTEGSGSLATWRTFGQIDPAYREVRLLPVNGMEGASAVAAGQATCLFEVIAPRSDFLDLLDANDSLAGELQLCLHNRRLRELHGGRTTRLQPGGIRRRDLSRPGPLGRSVATGHHRLSGGHR